MAITLGATTYSSVTWTTGDVITEAKLDNMVANDQAYDSHAAQGILLNNGLGLFGKESGGTNRALIGMNTDNNILAGNGTNEFCIQTVCKVRAYRNAAATVSTSAAKITLDAESYDIGTDFATGTFTAPVTGYYLAIGQLALSNVDAGEQVIVFIYANGAAYAQGKNYAPSLNDDPIATVSDVIPLTVGQTLELWGQVNGAGTEDISTGATQTYMTVHLLNV